MMRVLIPQLKPLNPYGLSKQLFDIHVLPAEIVSSVLGGAEVL
jgi:hypothetical protein